MSAAGRKLARALRDDVRALVARTLARVGSDLREAFAAHLVRRQRPPTPERRRRRRRRRTATDRPHPNLEQVAACRRDLAPEGSLVPTSASAEPPSPAVDLLAQTLVAFGMPAEVVRAYSEPLTAVVSPRPQPTAPSSALVIAPRSRRRHRLR